MTFESSSSLAESENAVAGISLGAFTGFNRMKRLRAPFQSFGILFVIRADSRVEIPAVVVETFSSNQPPDFTGADLFQIVERDDNVSYLYPRVVDIVLNFDLPTCFAKHANKRVAEHGIPQVPDMGSLIRIDIRVFDD